MAPLVFLSFSKADIVWRDRIRAAMTALRTTTGLRLWDYVAAAPGTVWTAELRKAIAEADVAILVLTESFLKSKFIGDEELPALLDRRRDGLQILPILFERCAFEEVATLASLNVFPGNRAIAEATPEDQEVLLSQLVKWTAQLLGTTDPSPAASSPPPALIDVSRLPLSGTRLVGRAKELLSLDACWNAFDVNVVYVAGCGGDGKSTLVEGWLSRMEADRFRGARRVFGWCFHAPEGAGPSAAADQFFPVALRAFGVPEPHPVLPWSRAELLVKAIRAERSLVVLDGLESHQPTSGPRSGSVRDIGLDFLLTSLARKNTGLLVVTSRRAPPSSLSSFSASVQILEMSHLSLDDSLLLWQALGAEGSTEDVEQVVRALEGHALSLTLFATLSRQTGRAALSLLNELNRAASPHERVLEKIRQQVSPEHLATLGVMGLFDRPVQGRYLDAVSKATADGPWETSIAELRDLHLLGPKNPGRPDEVDIHPQVRVFFADQWKRAEPGRWLQANQALYAFMLRSASPSPRHAEDLQPLHDAMVFGSRAGRHQEVLDRVYYNLLLNRGEQRSWSRFGALEADLAALAMLFEEPWTTPARGIAPRDHGFLFGQAGLYLGILGAFEEAVPCLEQGVALDAPSNPANASVTCGNLSRVHTLCGRLGDSVTWARRSIDLARSAHDREEEIIALTHLAHGLHYSGDGAKALQHFEQAEALFRDMNQGPMLWAGMGAQYCELLLDRGRWAEVIRRCESNIAAAPPEIPRAYERITLGVAIVAAAAEGNRGDLNVARSHLDEGLSAVRSGRQIELLPFALLARAAVYRYLGSQYEAGENMEEALHLSRATGMKCSEAEARLALAGRALEMGHRTFAAEQLSEARTIITSIGYHRRVKALELLEARTGGVS